MFIPELQLTGRAEVLQRAKESTAKPQQPKKKLGGRKRDDKSGASSGGSGGGKSRKAGTGRTKTSGGGGSNAYDADESDSDDLSGTYQQLSEKASSLFCSVSLFTHLKWLYFVF